ncbi:delta 8-sphingoloid desaturase protein [Ceraceosorus guamensis]|uniref:Delta 8-(E)-sphingolipid desaturase n=1 Tax=Ceraceosorus guamensis TaxID=1522189 RepID=A0A316WB07_9BASI|nr:delta 8-sphingoloid desaturase protein [Ceraceosorus guamensis]PWN45881.1 delta 8-sphingoloid desaturase protein [Ceraceosorus guamensis]
MRRSRLAERIAAGETLVLHADRIYKLDAWLSRHPGGELAILHFVGRDAHDEIEAYHSDGTLRRMKNFVIARLDPRDAPKDVGYKPLTPPVQLGYRSGKLDHPDAQWTAWQQAQGGLDGRSEEYEVEDLLSEANAAGMATTSEKPASERANAQSSRPQGFPLPVALLEPPVPPDGIDPAEERAISMAYREMHEQVKVAGLYTLRPIGYARELARYMLLFASFAYCYAQGHFLLSSLLLGLFWHQVTFSAHDAGHTGITGVHAIDRAIGIFIASPIGGLSIGWWCDNHDVHHLVTNHPEHDPDIQHMPFFAISPKFLVEKSPSSNHVSGSAEAEQTRSEEVKAPYGLWSSYYRRVLLFDAPSRFFLRHQHALYYIVMSLGRFNLYANSYGFLAKTARFNDIWWWAEVSGVGFFWAWFVALLHGCPDWKTRIGYLLISHIATSPLHVQIVLSHFAQSSDDLGLYESFPSRQVRTTMDVSCPPQLDFLHGGLHMQVSHHLFPRIPRHNLREVRDRFVRPFCEKHGLRYTEYGFVEGNGLVRDTLRNVAGQVKLLGKVAKAQARGELH